jgi:hypothetical protein
MVWPFNSRKKGNERKFVCPECGHSEAAGPPIRVEPAPDTPRPWRGIFAYSICARCGWRIPTPLAERWQGESVRKARKLWRELFRDEQRTGPREMPRKSQSGVKRPA